MDCIEISWVDMCRGCMDVSGDLLSLFPSEDNPSDKDLSILLTDLTSVEITKSDGLPTKLCHKCIKKTEALFKFKCLVQDTDKKLRRMFNQHLISEAKHSNKTISIDPIIYQTNEKSQDKKPVGKNYFSKKNTVQITLVEPTKTNDFEYVVKNLHKVQEGSSLSDFEIWHGDASDVEDQLNSNETSQVVQIQCQKSDNQISDINKLNEIIKSKNSDIDPNLKTEKKDETEEESESDSCQETEDNTLGSINDTITKIKEIKQDKKVIYQCTLCLENYEEIFKALSHIVSLHVPKTGPFYCVVCEKDCSSKKELKSHIKNHTGETPYICFLCDKAYTRRRYLKRHMGLHTDFPRHRCSKCGKRFKVKSELDTHALTHGDGAAYTCNHCQRKFNFKANYKRHLITHLDPQGSHLPKFPCTVCKKRFFNNRNLDTHMRVHTGEKPFRCEECGKTFSQGGNLINHRRIHENVRKFICNECGKSFNQKATLKEHLILHTGKKPFVCNVCGNSYTFSAALRRHMWSHSDLKPFECDLCDAKFSGKYDLKRHMISHSTSKPKRRKFKNKVVTASELDLNNSTFQIDPLETTTIQELLLTEDQIQILQENSNNGTTTYYLV